MKLQNAKNLITQLCMFPNHKVNVITPDGKVRSIDFHSIDVAGDITFQIDDITYNYRDLGYYDPCVDGAVNAIRIYNRNGYQPVATLAFAFGDTFTFDWDRCDIREMFAQGITAYTVFYDTRLCQAFTSWIHISDEKDVWPDLGNPDSES